MEFWSTTLGLLRLKRVVIPAVLIALTLGALAYVGTPNSYTSSTTMVLTTTEYGGSESQDPSQPTDLTNPMLNFNESLRTTAGILISAMGTRDVATQLGATGPTVLVVNDGRTNPDLLGLNGPFVYIVAKSTSREAAARVVKQAQALMRTKLKEWQSSLGAPEKTFVSLVDVVPPSTPEVDRGQAVKLGMVAFLFGLLLSLGIAYFGHQRRTRRRARAVARRFPPPPIDYLEQTRRRRPPPASIPLPETGDRTAEPARVSSLTMRAEPARVRESSRNGAEPVAVPAQRMPEPVAVPASASKPAEPDVVRVPMKLNGRSRNNMRSRNR